MASQDLTSATHTLAAAARDDAPEGVVLLAMRDVVTSIQTHHDVLPYLSRLLSVTAGALEVAAVYVAADNRLLHATLSTDVRQAIEARLWDGTLPETGTPTEAVTRLLATLARPEADADLPDSDLLEDLEASLDDYRDRTLHQ
jgi:hypothetical protein